MKTRAIVTAAVIAVMTVMGSAEASAARRAPRMPMPFSPFHITTVTDVANSLSVNDAMEFVPMYQKYATEVEKIVKSDASMEQKEAEINALKDLYTFKFAVILDTESTEVALNSPFSSIMRRALPF